MRTGLTVLSVILITLSSLSIDTLASDHFTEGKHLFRSGEYQKAHAELMQAFREDPANLDISFFMGQTAFELGDFEGAVAAFERILIIEPHAPRVKLELAKAYLKLNSPQVAKKYFHEVLETNPPAVVRQNIQRFLTIIEESERSHFLSGFVEAGMLYDNNVGVFPNSDTVIIGGLPISLDGKQEGDTGLQLSAGLKHLYRLGTSPYSWKTDLVTYNRFYQDINDENINYIGVATGISRQTDQTLWEIQVDTGQVNRDAERYLNLVGVNLIHRCLLSKSLYLNVSVALQDKDYNEYDEQDATAWMVSFNPTLDYGINRFSVITGLEFENADADFYSYERFTAGFHYERILPLDFRIYSSFRYQKTSYDDEMPLFGVDRDDKQLNFEVGIVKTLWRSIDHQNSLSVKVSNNYARADSNIELYEYNKNVTLTTLTMAF